MEESTEQAVERAIATMRAKLGEQLTIDDMAQAAMFSKFHFARLFQRTTGVSPGRFLSALRLQQAKRLLVSTSLNVAEISLRVGYNSVGTFSSRFSRSVGMPPTTFRRMAGFAPSIATDPAFVRHRSTSRISGLIRNPGEDADVLVFAGLFPERIPEGRPVRCAVLPGPGSYQFDCVPCGSWYVLTHAVLNRPGVAAREARGPDGPVWVGTRGPVSVTNDSDLRVDVVLKPAGSLDPPVLLALADARDVALTATTRPQVREPRVA